MNQHLLLLILGLVSVVPRAPVSAATATENQLAASGQSAPPTELPVDVRALLPQGATSFFCQRLPVGPQAFKVAQTTEMLVHVWGATRANSPDTLNAYKQFTASPFCVDIFRPIWSKLGQRGWHLVSSAVYLDTNAPSLVRTHWLNPGKKQGPVLEIVSSNGASDASSGHTILAWHEGFETDHASPAPQMFSSKGFGESGSVWISHNFDGVDERGLMTITATTEDFLRKQKSTTSYRWNGERFARVVLK